MEIIYHFALLPILLLSVYWVYLLRRYRKTRQGLSPLYSGLILLSLAIFALYIPLYFLSMGVPEAFLGWLAEPTLLSRLGMTLAHFGKAIGMAILEIPRHFAMAQEYNPAITEAGEGYFLSQVLLWTLAPIGTASFVYVLLKSVFKGIRLRMNRTRPVYYFSSLNEKSFTLARNLHEDAKGKKKKHRPFLVFCQVDSGDESNTELQYSSDAEDLGAIFERDPIYALDLKNPLRQQVKIFLMDEDEDANILSLLRMEEKICPVACNPMTKVAYPQSDIYVFSSHESSELLFDQTLNRFQVSPQDTAKNARYNLHLIDETKLIVQKLLLDHPLFEPLFHVPEPKTGAMARSGDDRNDLISVLAIGGGMLGMELVRSAMICGLTDNYEFQIQVVDANARQLEKQFRCFSSYKEVFGQAASDTEKIHLPDVFSGDDGIGKNIRPVFHEADCRTTDFDEILEKYCAQSNYIVIATGDDELNISTARHLQRWYARQDIMHGRIPSRPPMIFAAIRNSERYEALCKLEEDTTMLSASQQLFIFGSNDAIFSADVILHRPLDASAALFNACYDSLKTINFKTACVEPQQRQDILHSLSGLSQIQQFSNHMVALHALYKMQDLLFAGKQPKLLLDYRYHRDSKTQADTDQLFATLADALRRGGTKLNMLEHRRWNLFNLLDGWECFPMEMIRACLEQDYTPNKNKPHQLPLLKLHGCIVPYKDLDRLSTLCGKEKDYFTGFDAGMCTASIFAWLDLEAHPEHARSIRIRLKEAAEKRLNSDRLICTYRELLDIIVDTFDKKK